MPGPAMVEQFGSMNLAAEDGGILSDVQARHGHSAQPESQQVMAVMRAVLEVIAAQGLSPSPTAIFAAIMSALEKPETQASAQVVAAMATLLDLTLPRVPNAVLRSKFNSCCQIITSVLQQHSTQAPIARSLLGCLGALLAAAEPSAWLAAAGAWALLLGGLTDGRPKVRKAAAKAATEVLAAYQVAPPGLLGSASDALAGVAGTVLPGPAAAARAAAAASNKQRSAAEAAITAAVGDALHLLGALRSMLPLVSAPAASAIVDQCLKLYTLRQPLLSRHTSDALSALLVSPGCRLSPAQVSALLSALLDSDTAAASGASSSSGNAQQQEAAAALSRALEAGLRRLGAAGEEPAAQAALLALLPRVVHALVAQLGSASEGVRWGAATALKELLRDLVGPPLIAAAAQRQAAAAAAGGGASAGRGGGLGSNPLSSVVVGVGAALGPRYMEAWSLALPVAGVLLEALGSQGAPLARPLIAQLGTLLDGQEAAAEEEEAAAAASGQQVAGPNGAGRGNTMEAAVAALGVALRSQGPDVVLEVLPLQLQEGLAGTAQPRTWLLPLLRRYVRGASLASWASTLLPLARSMGGAAASASAAGRKPLALSCHTLELQCWAALPAYASWPSDAASAYPALVKELAAAAHTRPDLRPAIGAALCRLALQPRGMLVAAGRLEGLPASAAEEARAAGRRKRAAAAGAAGAPGVADSDDEDDPEAAAAGDEDEDDVPSTSGRGSPQQQQLWGDGGAPPAWYTPDTAAAQLAALAPTVDKWMRLLAKLYVESDPEARGPLGDALGALARIAPPQLLLSLFKMAADKLARVMREAAAQPPPPDPLMEGGATAAERAATFLELMLALGPGLVEGALGTLAQAARQQVLGSDPALQKKGYKVLAWLAEQRPTWLATAAPELLTLLLTTSTKTASSARRFRLRVLRPLILLLEAPGGDACPQLQLPAGLAGAAELASPEAAVRQAAVLRALVGELVLGIKEINVKTRTAAYELLVELAHELDEARPPSLGPAGADSDMEEEEEYGAANSAQQRAQQDASTSSSGGGLMDFVQLILGGLVGSTPHMQSAAVMALARLTYEFAGALEGLVPQLLPAILLLLRSNSREVVRSVLGYLKVCAMRLPADVLLPWLGPMQEGMLLWAEDSKNKFKLKVRLILERLVRRCGVEAVAAVTPAQDARLLVHIRKQAAAKERRRAASRAGSQAGDLEADDSRSQRSAVTRDSKARTARASEWGHTKIFSDGGDSDDQQQQQQRRGQQQGGPGSVKSGRSRGAGGGGGVSFMEEGEEPMDLLEAGSSRQLSRQAAGQRAAAARQRQGNGADKDLPHAADGRLVIEDEEAKGRAKALKRKRGREEGWLGDSDDSDMEDMRSFAGLSAAMKSVANAKSVRFAPSIAASLGGKSKAGSMGGKSRAGSVGGRSAQHSGERYKPKKSGTGGDVKSGGGVEPYAYWQLDRKMLNRRRGKQAAASKGLAGVVRGAAAGVAKGGKARRAQQASKRAKRQ